MLRSCALVALFVTCTSAQEYRLHRFDTERLSDAFHCEGADVGDLDRDGHVDVVAGPWWYRGPEFVERVPLYPAKPFDPKSYSDAFFSFVRDLDGDGWARRPRDRVSRQGGALVREPCRGRRFLGPARRLRRRR